METYEVIIKFVDGEILKLRGVSDYKANELHYYCEINGYRQFFEKSTVKYIGRKFDLFSEL